MEREDVDVLTRALDDPEPLVRKHAAWALERIRVRESGEALHDSRRASGGRRG